MTQSNVGRAIRLIATCVVAISVAALIAGCGTERSKEAYCAKYQSGFDKIKQQYPDVDQYSHTRENPLLLILRTTSAAGDIVALIGDMAKVAPDDIQSDTERVHDSLKKQMDAMGQTAGDAASLNFKGLIGDFASGAVDSIVNSGAMTRMDNYVVANCGGKHMFSASPQ